MKVLRNIIIIRKMSKQSRVKILDKRVVGNIMFYLVKNKGSSEWKKLEDLKDILDLIL